MKKLTQLAFVCAFGVGLCSGSALSADGERPMVLPPAVQPQASPSGDQAEPRTETPIQPESRSRPANVLSFEDRVAEFVQTYYLSGDTKSDDELRLIYADSVEYFDKRRLTKARVLADKRAYFAKWPQRKYVLMRDTLKVSRRAGPTGVYDVAFQYTFDVGSPARVSRGRGVAELTMDLSADGGRITREAGRVIARW